MNEAKKASLRRLLELRKLEFREGERMAVHTTFHIGGRAAFFIVPKTEEEAIAAVQSCLEAECPYFCLGRGSNLLVQDEDLPLVILSCGELSEIRREGNRLLAQSGAPLSKIGIFAREQSLSGMEFAYGIPGSLGGGVMMNAGAYGGEMKDIVRRVRYLDEAGNVGEKTLEELEFRYRHSWFSGRNCLILSAELELTPGDPQQIQEKMDDLMNRRREKQPLEYGSAGSTFKRPEGAYAAALIDQCGLKGYTVGGAQVSEKHAGFVINRGGATCADVRALMAHVIQTVQEQTGYELKPEVLMLSAEE